MRKAIAALLALALSFSAVGQVFAADQNIAYPAQNPSSTQANLGPRYVRITLGNWMRDALGPSASAAGTYANLSLSPGAGLYVTVGPTNANSQGTVYQIVQDDPNPLPTSVPAGVPTSPTPLPADTTLIAAQATQSVASAPLGALTAPSTSGQSIYYLVEAQITSGVAGNPQPMMFVSSSGHRSYITVNTNLTDQISYQVVAGTASSSPVKPATTSGWIALGYVLVPYGASSITSGMISMAPAFTGFVQNATVVHVSPNASPTPDSGNAAITGQMAASQFISTAMTGTAPFIVNSTTQVANLNAATAGTAGNVTGIVALANGGTGTATPSGTTCGASANLSCTGGFPNTVVDLKPSISLTGVTATNGSISSLTLPGLTSTACLGTSSGGVVQAGSCLSSFTVNGNSPVNVSQVGNTATVSCPNCAATNLANTFTAPQTTAASCTATSGTPHCGSYTWSLNSSDWNGSSAVSSTGTLTFSNGVFTFGPPNSNLSLGGGLSPAIKQTLVCVIGDSISQLESNDNSTFTSGSVSNYPYQIISDLGNATLWNQGSSGGKSQDLINRAVPIIPNNCDLVVFELGTNDTSPLLPSGDPTSAYSTFTTLVNDVTAKEPSSTKYIFVTVRQYGNSCSNVAPCSTITTWNNDLKSTASGMGSNAAVFDMETSSTWYQVCGGTTPCFPDKTHPNQYAAALMGSDITTIAQGLSLIQSAIGTTNIASLNIIDQGQNNTILQAPVGRDLVLQSGAIPAGASSSAVTNVDVMPAEGNGGQMRVFDQRGNYLSLQTAGITIPLQYSGAPNPFIQTSSGALGLDIFTPQLNFPNCGQVWFGTNVASSMSPNGTCGSSGTVWNGQILVQAGNNAGFAVHDTGAGGVNAAMIPGNTADGFGHDLVWWDAANSAAMATLGDGSTNGDFVLAKSTAHVSAPSGFIAGTVNSYAPAALVFGTGGTNYLTQIFDVASGSLVQGIIPTVFGIQYGPQGSSTPVLAIDGNGDLGLFGTLHASGFAGSGASLTGLPGNQFAAGSFTIGSCLQASSATAIGMPAQTGGCVVLSPGAQQTGTINVSGNITSGANLNASGANLSGLTASSLVCTDASKNLSTSGCGSTVSTYTVYDLDFVGTLSSVTPTTINLPSAPPSTPYQFEFTFNYTTPGSACSGFCSVPLLLKWGATAPAANATAYCVPSVIGQLNINPSTGAGGSENSPQAIYFDYHTSTANEWEAVMVWTSGYLASTPYQGGAVCTVGHS